MEKGNSASCRTLQTHVAFARSLHSGSCNPPPKNRVSKPYCQSVCDSKGGAVTELIQFQPQTGTPTLLRADQAAVDMTNWFAVSTRSQHEKFVAGQLECQGVTAFLPTVTEIHRWSDRRKLVEQPLFRGYLFVRGSLTPAFRRTVLVARGVVSFITMQGEPVPVPDEQIEVIQRLLNHKIACMTHPFLKVGQRVRVRGGALDGVEGIFTCCNKDQSLVISIDAIQRSLAVRIEGYDVEAV